MSSLRSSATLLRSVAALVALLCACVQPDLESAARAPRLHHRTLHFDGEDLARAQGEAPAGAALALAAGERFESQVVEARARFHEVLASWNVGCPDGLGLRFELSVRRADDGSWSPWLHVGDWGSVDTALPRTSEFDGGRIDVDFLSGDVDFDALRFAIAAEGSGTRHVEVAGVSLCLTGSGGANGPSNGARATPLSERVLDVPARSQRSEDPALAARICSPTCVAMVMAYHGVERDTAEVAELLYDARHDIYGNWTRAVQGACVCGVPGHLQRFSEWSEVEALVARGIPLVVSVRVEPGELRGAPYSETPGHLLVLVGFDAHGDVVVNDPAASTPAQVRRVYRRADLERVWLAKNGVAYVLGDEHRR